MPTRFIVQIRPNIAVSMDFFLILNTLLKKFLKDAFVASTHEHLSSQEFMGYLKTALLHTFLNYV